MLLIYSRFWFSRKRCKDRKAVIMGDHEAGDGRTGNPKYQGSGEQFLAGIGETRITYGLFQSALIIPMLSIGTLHWPFPPITSSQ